VPFAADAGAFASLGGQDVGVAGVALRQRIQSCSRRDWASIGLAHDALVGVQGSSTLARPAQARIAGVIAY
jgi:hypothetical protein